LEYIALGDSERAPANIVKVEVTYNNNVYVATLPIAVIVINDTAADDYSFNIKDNSGFTEVVYTSDGKSPKYNQSNPFEIVIKDKHNEKDADVSSIFEYEWGKTSIGETCVVTNSEEIWTSANLLSERSAKSS
jgi:hypothetical protein